MYLRYSLSVVAPIARSSPRASAGFSMFEASIEPSAAPAPTSVCSSSMNRMICPSDSVTSFSTAFRRSSNSPRYFAPATSAARSSATIRFGFSTSGTSPRNDSLRQPFDDRRLADAGLADQHGIIFCAPRENLHDAADFLVAADHRIELAAPRQFRQVARVLLQRPIGGLRDSAKSRDGCRASPPWPAEWLRGSRRARSEFGRRDRGPPRRWPAGCARSKRTRP